MVEVMCEARLEFHHALIHLGSSKHRRLFHVHTCQAAFELLKQLYARVSQGGSTSGMSRSAQARRR